jgi:hypothetical protein
VLVVKGDQKIEHFFLAFRQGHGALLQSAPILGELKAKKQAIKSETKKLSLRAGFQCLESLTIRESNVPPSSDLSSI